MIILSPSLLVTLLSIAYNEMYQYSGYSVQSFPQVGSLLLWWGRGRLLVIQNVDGGGVYVLFKCIFQVYSNIEANVNM